MISHEDLLIAIRDIQEFVDATTPEHPVRTEWSRARGWLLHVLAQNPGE